MLKCHSLENCTSLQTYIPLSGITNKSGSTGKSKVESSLWLYKTDSVPLLCPSNKESHFDQVKLGFLEVERIERRVKIGSVFLFGGGSKLTRVHEAIVSRPRHIRRLAMWSSRYGHGNMCFCTQWAPLQTRNMCMRTPHSPWPPLHPTGCTSLFFIRPPAHGLKLQICLSMGQNRVSQQKLDLRNN